MRVQPSLVHRLFYPQVPLVLAAQKGRRVSAMPVVSYSSVSDSPPMISVSCSPKAFTCRLALRAGGFSLSVLDRSFVGAVALLATLSGAKLEDKIVRSGLSHKTGSKLDVPVLDQSMATLECRVESASKTGDHLLIIAAVEAAYASEAFSGFWDYRKYGPILYAGWKEGLSVYSGTSRRTLSRRRRTS